MAVDVCGTRYEIGICRTYFSLLRSVFQAPYLKSKRRYDGTIEANILMGKAHDQLQMG